MQKTMSSAEADRDSETHWNRGDGRAACGAADGHLTTDVEVSCLKCQSAVIEAGANIIEYDPDDYR